PQSIATGRDDPVRIRGILELLLEPQKRVVVEGVSLDHGVLKRGRRAVLTPPVVSRDLDELGDDLVDLLVLPRIAARGRPPGQEYEGAKHLGRRRIERAVGIPSPTEEGRQIERPHSPHRLPERTLRLHHRLARLRDHWSEPHVTFRGAGVARRTTAKGL